MSEVKDIKEVRKEAIKQLREITELSKDEIKNGDEITAILDKFDLASLIVVLDYIEELEKENKLVSDTCAENAKSVLDIEKPYKTMLEKIDEKINEFEKDIEKLQINQNEVIGHNGDDLSIREEIYEIEEKLKFLRNLKGE